jgi:transposase
MDTIKRRRRAWPEPLKREIVAAAFAPGASVSAVARRYDVNTNLVFSWREQFGAPMETAPRLVPVTIRPDVPPASASSAAHDTIEIEFPSGCRVRVGPGVKPAVLRLVLDALERRR